MNITFTTIKTENSLSVVATLKIEVGVTVSNMPRVSEEILENTLRAYMERDWKHSIRPMNSITLAYSSQRQLERKVKAVMLQWGYTVIPKAAKWTPMAEFRSEIGCPSSTLHKILSDPECPDFPGKQARRRNRIVVTPALRQFVKKQADRSKQSS